MSKFHFWLSNFLFYTSHSRALISLFVLSIEIYNFQNLSTLSEPSINRVIVYSIILVFYTCTIDPIHNYCKKYRHIGSRLHTQ
jgi:hypothetical protein